MKRIFPIFAVLTAVLLTYALYAALVLAPKEQTMGDVQRIFYYHVPSAWTAFLLFFINFVASIQYLVRPRPFADRLAKWVAIAIGVGACVGAFVVPLPEGVEPGSVATTGPRDHRNLFPNPQVFLRAGHRRTGRYDCRGWSRFLHYRPGHWPFMGATGLGYLVDMGCPAHFNSGAVADLRQLPHAPSIF